MHSLKTSPHIRHLYLKLKGFLSKDMTTSSYIWLLIFSNALSFLIGAYQQASGGYLALKFTDQRKAQERDKLLNNTFKEAKVLSPELIKEMQNDFSENKAEGIIYFFIVPNKKGAFNTGIPMFSYYENEHENLLSQVNKLEQLGLVSNITRSNYPKYEFKEEFIRLLLNNKHTLPNNGINADPKALV